MSRLTVRGHGQALAAPDEATVTLVLESVRATAEEALADVAARGAELGAVLDGLGVDRSARTTSGVTVNEHGEHVDGRWQHRGYRAQSTLTVRLDDVELVGRVLGESVGRTGAHVQGPDWTVALDNPARLAACRLAAEDARRRAETYATALGTRLGAITRAREPNVAAGPVPRAGMRMLAMEAAADVPAEAGEQIVSATIDVTFALEQG